jgi:hypothetical protein
MEEEYRKIERQKDRKEILSTDMTKDTWKGRILRSRRTYYSCGEGIFEYTLECAETTGFLSGTFIVNR